MNVIKRLKFLLSNSAIQLEAYGDSSTALDIAEELGFTAKLKPNGFKSYDGMYEFLETLKNESK